MRSHQVKLDALAREAKCAQNITDEYRNLANRINAQAEERKKVFKSEMKAAKAKINALEKENRRLLQRLAQSATQLESMDQLYQDRAYMAAEIERTRNDLLKARKTDNDYHELSQDHHQQEIEINKLRQDLLDCQERLRQLKGADEELGALRSAVVAGRRTRFRQHVIVRAAQTVATLRPFLGVTFVSEPEEGTLLKEVRIGGSAYAGGLRTGDVVARVNGQPTRTKAGVYMYFDI